MALHHAEDPPLFKPHPLLAPSPKASGIFQPRPGNPTCGNFFPAEHSRTQSAKESGWVLGWKAVISKLCLREPLEKISGLLRSTLKDSLPTTFHLPWQHIAQRELWFCHLAHW
ncbi:UNVERIFIED_CONTAM: hypothetical protein K2H54_038541 [Gekko kuhli]